MSRFRKIDVRIWNDEKFAALSERGKLVFFLLLTHPGMTALGAMRATQEGLAAELSLAPEAFREAFREALLKGMVKVDEKAHMIALPNFIKYNPPASPNVVKAWEACLDLLPECGLKDEVIQNAIAITEGYSEAYGKALPEVFRKVCRNKEKEKEKEQEIEKEQDEQKYRGGRDSGVTRERPAVPHVSTKEEAIEWLRTTTAFPPDYDRLAEKMLRGQLTVEELELAA